jgi:hypothetical protein
LRYGVSLKKDHPSGANAPPILGVFTAWLKEGSFTTASTIAAPFDFAEGRLEVVPFDDRFKLSHHRN